MNSQTSGRGWPPGQTPPFPPHEYARKNESKSQKKHLDRQPRAKPTKQYMSEHSGYYASYVTAEQPDPTSDDTPPAPWWRAPPAGASIGPFNPPEPPFDASGDSMATNRLYQTSLSDGKAQPHYEWRVVAGGFHATVRYDNRTVQALGSSKKVSANAAAAAWIATFGATSRRRRDGGPADPPPAVVHFPSPTQAFGDRAAATAQHQHVHVNITAPEPVLRGLPYTSAPPIPLEAPPPYPGGPPPQHQRCRDCEDLERRAARREAALERRISQLEVALERRVAQLEHLTGQLEQAVIGLLGSGSSKGDGPWAIRGIICLTPDSLNFVYRIEPSPILRRLSHISVVSSIPYYSTVQLRGDDETPSNLTIDLMEPSGGRTHPFVVEPTCHVDWLTVFSSLPGSLDRVRCCYWAYYPAVSPYALHAPAQVVHVDSGFVTVDGRVTVDTIESCVEVCGPAPGRKQREHPILATIVSTVSAILVNEIRARVENLVRVQAPPGEALKCAIDVTRPLPVDFAHQTAPCWTSRWPARLAQGQDAVSAAGSNTKGDGPEAPPPAPASQQRVEFNPLATPFKGVAPVSVPQCLDEWSSAAPPMDPVRGTSEWEKIHGPSPAICPVPEKRPKAAAKLDRLAVELFSAATPEAEKLVSRLPAAGARRITVADLGGEEEVALVAALGKLKFQRASAQGRVVIDWLAKRHSPNAVAAIKHILWADTDATTAAWAAEVEAVRADPYPEPPDGISLVPDRPAPPKPEPPKPSSPKSAKPGPPKPSPAASSPPAADKHCPHATAAVTPARQRESVVRRLAEKIYNGRGVGVASALSVDDHSRKLLVEAADESGFEWRNAGCDEAAVIMMAATRGRFSAVTHLLLLPSLDDETGPVWEALLGSKNRVHHLYSRQAAIDAVRCALSPVQYDEQVAGNPVGQDVVSKTGTNSKGDGPLVAGAECESQFDQAHSFQEWVAAPSPSSGLGSMLYGTVALRGAGAMPPSARDQLNLHGYDPGLAGTPETLDRRVYAAEQLFSTTQNVVTLGADTMEGRPRGVSFALFTDIGRTATSESPLGLQLRQRAEAQGGSAGRGANFEPTLADFNSWDSLRIVTRQETTSITMEASLMKLVLARLQIELRAGPMYQQLDWDLPRVPAAYTVAGADPSAFAASGLGGSYGIRTIDATPGTRLGFPFAGSEGTFRIALDEAAVRPGSVVVYMPSNLAAAFATSPGEALFWLFVMFAPWPFAFEGAALPMTGGEIRYISNSQLVYVPGDLSFTVIWPRKSGREILTLADATGNAQYLPARGPHVTFGVAGALDYSAATVATEHPLASFMQSWWPSQSVGAAETAIRVLNAVAGCGPYLKAVCELASVVTARRPRLCRAAAQVWEPLTSDGYAMPRLTADIAMAHGALVTTDPWPSTRWLRQTQPSSWNAVATGLRQIAPVALQLPWPPSAGGQSLVFRLQSRVVALVENVVRFHLALPREVYTRYPHDLRLFPAAYELLLRYYPPALGQSVSHIGMWAEVFRRVSGLPPSALSDGDTLFARRLVVQGEPEVQVANNGNRLVPMFLSDCWLEALTYRPPQGLSGIPPISVMAGGPRFLKVGDTVRRYGANTVLPGRDPESFDAMSPDTRTDVEAWNSRLWLLDGGSHATVSGLYVTATGHEHLPRWNATASSAYAVCTTTVPAWTSDGEVVFGAVTPANAPGVMQILAGHGVVAVRQFRPGRPGTEASYTLRDAVTVPKMLDLASVKPMAASSPPAAGKQPSATDDSVVPSQ